MKKKKEIEIPKNKYIYQRYNGIITKYIVDEEYCIAVETGIANRKDTILLLGKVSENIIDLIEAGDYVNGILIEDIEEIDNKKVFYSNGEMIAWTNRDKGIETILTKEQYQANCYTVERK